MTADFGKVAADLDRAGVEDRRRLKPDQPARPIVQHADVDLAGEIMHELGGAGRHRGDAPERAVGLLEHLERLDLVPEGAAPQRVELERRRIGLQHLLQPARAVAGGGREILDPDGGDGGAGIGDLLVGEALGKLGMHMHRAGDLERRAEREAQRLDAVLIGEAETEHGADLALGGEHLERDLGHDRERAPGAGQHPREIVAGDVLHHPAAGPDGLAAAVDRLHAEHMIARRARKDAPAAGEIGGDHAADGALPRSEAEHGPEIDRLEGKFLLVLGERLLDLGDRRAGHAPPAPARSAHKAECRPGSRC